VVVQKEDRHQTWDISSTFTVFRFQFNLCLTYRTCVRNGLRDLPVTTYEVELWSCGERRIIQSDAKKFRNASAPRNACKVFAAYMVF
jgi:hypothetical protein